jgi:FlaA1/EpsC-like NDP-sugar epimerase
MTRFVMTLEQSVNLIEQAIMSGESGDIVIPKLVSMNVKDLIEIFSEKYNKPIKNIGIKPGEKLLESLINSSQSARIRKHNEYTHIKSSFGFKDEINVDALIDYNSTINPLTKDELYCYLDQLNLL